jgi:predicted kinase
MKQLLNKNWNELCNEFDFIADMHGVQQSPVHHAEGDVAIHTKMVLHALTGLPEYQALPEQVQHMLWISALLHDVEKRSTTFTEPEGAIVSPGHAKKGAATARQILFTQFNMPFAEREQIVNLVRYHGLPIWLMHKPNPQKALLKASLVVNTAWLAILAQADMLGRICKDQYEMLERIQFFEAYCHEQNAWGQPYPFGDGLSRFTYFRKEHESPDHITYDNTICTVIITSGLPGMGKDTYIQSQYKDWPVVSLDAIRQEYKLKPDDRSATGWVVQQAKERARVYLRAKQNFVWNATNITRQMRSQLIDLFTSYNATVRLIYVERPYKTWLAQNKARQASVPQNIMNKLLFKLEVPSPSEAHEVEYIV